MSTSVLELPRTHQQPRPVDRDAPKGVTQVAVRPQLATDEIESLHRDDAMAAGMIAVILGCAFMVLLALTVCVNVWTMSVTG